MPDAELDLLLEAGCQVVVESARVSSDAVIMIVMLSSMEMTGYDNSVHMAHMIKIPSWTPDTGLGENERRAA